MIGIRIQGRLGNQLFQYAFIYAASKKLKTPFYIDQYIEHSVLDKYFENIGDKTFGVFRRLFRIKGFKNAFSFYLRRLYYRCRVYLNHLSIVEYDYEAKAADVALRDRIIYQGYFQSEAFFSDFAKLIRDKLTLKRLFVDEFDRKYSNLYQTKTIVTIHIRRTDYQNLEHLNLGGNDLSLPLDYYKKAISKFNKQQVHFVFISDDLNFVNENFGDIADKTISPESEIIDFQHLLNADACIISNSTFSWWGAWLNNKPNKIIYAPKYFMGWRLKQERPKNIYPESWNLIEF